MCGIVGAIRTEGSVVDGLIEGLRVLEYRGYDSSGVAVASGSSVLVRKKQGRLSNLEEVLEDGALANGRAGIGHTRWATHGAPSDRNAHPHAAGSGKLALVHNGILENHQVLRDELLAAGVEFSSDTDSEVLAHLVAKLQADEGLDLAGALRAALSKVEGYYAVAILCEGEQGPELVCARSGPPLAVAMTPEAAYLASDVLGLLPHSNQVIYLEDGDVAVMRPGGIEVTDLAGNPIVREAQEVEWNPEDSGLGVWPHYMLKEIHEQPDVLARSAFNRIDLDAADVNFEDGNFSDEMLRKVERIQVLACGTALHAGWIARYLIEGLARVPVDVDFASEFRYRNPLLAEGTMALAFTQSGETADTLAACRLAKELGASVASICNVAGSTQVRESDQVALTYAGPEIGVASTKAFTAQVVVAVLLAVRIGRAKGTLSEDRARELLTELRGLRPKLESMLSERSRKHVRDLARAQAGAKGFLFIGRGVNFPVALEGALKLKEISYMHAEGYAAGEMKHGPIALIDPGMTIVAIHTQGPIAEKVRANIEQVKARGGLTLSVGSDQASHEIADLFIDVPATSEWLSPILNTVPLQLLSYYVADMRGCDIDKPRNLAKSVTVE
ncbi:MAG: glucosamine--fructose-6-phosphate aminotransferase (isomerizing) [Planctomycetota bacterium]|jgi:glucosamine--fructose-6-phosphate aminotransferase (isomerizing)